MNNAIERGAEANSVTIQSLSCDAGPAEVPIIDTADSRSRTSEEGEVRDKMIQCLLNFVSQLSRKYYDVYVLSELEELPDKAISERLSLPIFPGDIFPIPWQDRPGGQIGNTTAWRLAYFTVRMSTMPRSMNWPPWVW